MTTSPPPDRFDERLHVPLWWWPAWTALAALLAAVVHGGAGGPRAVVPYTVALPLTWWLVWRAGRGRVRVAGGLLHVPGARLPLASVGRALPLDAAGVRRLAGSQRHPWSFVVRKGFVPGGVLVELDDPSDDTPYWVVPTRRPADLVAALTRGAP